jgi:hypothetical protein
MLSCLNHLWTVISALVTMLLTMVGFGCPSVWGLTTLTGVLSGEAIQRSSMCRCLLNVVVFDLAWDAWHYLLLRRKPLKYSGDRRLDCA